MIGFTVGRITVTAGPDANGMCECVCSCGRPVPPRRAKQLRHSKRSGINCGCRHCVKEATRPVWGRRRKVAVTDGIVRCCSTCAHHAHITAVRDAKTGSLRGYRCEHRQLDPEDKALLKPCGGWVWDSQ